jgi:hypothetical protein
MYILRLTSTSDRSVIVNMAHVMSIYQYKDGCVFTMSDGSEWTPKETFEQINVKLSEAISNGK